MAGFVDDAHAATASTDSTHSRGLRRRRRALRRRVPGVPFVEEGRLASSRRILPAARTSGAVSASRHTPRCAPVGYLPESQTEGLLAIHASPQEIRRFLGPRGTPVGGRQPPAAKIRPDERRCTVLTDPHQLATRAESAPDVTGRKPPAPPPRPSIAPHARVLARQELLLLSGPRL